MIPILEGVAPFGRRALRDRSWVHVALISILATVVIAAGILRHAQGTYEDSGLTMPEALTLLDFLCLGAMACLALLAAPAAAGAAMAQELRTGTVDQLRMTPLSAGTLALGVAVGSPAVVYLMLTGPALLHLALGVLGVVPLAATVMALLILGLWSLALSLCFTALPLLVPRQRVSAGIVALPMAGLLIANFFLGAMSNVRDFMPWAYLQPGGSLSALYLDQVPSWYHLVRGPGAIVPVGNGLAGLIPFGSLLAGAVLAAFGALLCIRQLHDPDQPALTKKQALLGFVLALSGLIGPQCLQWLTDRPSIGDRYHIGVAFLFLSVPLLAIFGALCTPSRRNWTAYLSAGRFAPLHDGAPVYYGFLLMVLFLVGVVGLVVGKEVEPRWYLLYWCWLVLVLSTGLQALRVAAQSAGGQLLVLFCMVGAAIGMLACQDWLHSFYGDKTGAVPMTIAVALVPAFLFTYERYVARRLRSSSPT